MISYRFYIHSGLLFVLMQVTFAIIISEIIDIVLSEKYALTFFANVTNLLKAIPFGLLKAISSREMIFLDRSDNIIWLTAVSKSCKLKLCEAQNNKLTFYEVFAASDCFLEMLYRPHFNY